MPVPVPRSTKLAAHLVIKRSQQGSQDSSNPSVFQNLANTLPVSPRGPPPSFGTREEWINSLPSWRRSKPRMIWDARLAAEHQNNYFQPGLTAAANASVIKGNRAQAHPPPVSTSLVDDYIADVSPISPPHSMYYGFDGDADDELSSESSMQDLSHVNNVNGRMVGSPISVSGDHLDMEQHPQSRAREASPEYLHDDALDVHIDRRSAFSPVLEDHFSDEFGDEISSPAGPVTPFGEFVDRAVAAAVHGCNVPEWSSDQQATNHDEGCDIPSCQSQPPQSPEIPKEPAPPESVVAPCATPAYKALAEPLSEWVANYVWKVCTTGMTLPAVYTPLAPSHGCSDSTPAYLAESVHSVLLSTLLQPSAVFLALWYIVRLPVYFGHIAPEVEQVKEYKFRQELLGDSRNGMEPNLMQTTAPFRLILLGCMLANKWLDDHTFSNKTWHTISNIPIRSLNKLESLALDLFEYDLSVPTHAWSQWLAHVQSYHMSLASPAHSQPISRPSTNPHSIIRRVIEELVDSPVYCEVCRFENGPGTIFEPIFMGLEERRKDRQEKHGTTQVDMLEIDLDENGPLREEYLPRRRVSGNGSTNNHHSRDSSCHSLRSGKQCDKDNRALGPIVKEQCLPPPSEWSPAGDEPILREKNKNNTRYVAVQPSVAPIPPPRYPPFSGTRYQDPCYGSFCPGESFETASAHEPNARCLLPPPYTEFADGAFAPLHSCFISQPYGYENLQSNVRFWPHSRYEYRCPDMGMTTSDFQPFAHHDSQWSDPYVYPAHPLHPYGPPPAVSYQLTWLRT